MRPSELSDLLWAQVDRVAPHLLPNGKKEGHEWVAGNVNGDKGNSLKVNLSGKKKWADFAEGDGGDMLDLWMACRGINLHQAMQEAKAFLGIKDDDHHFDAKREKKFSRPDRKKIARYVNPPYSNIRPWVEKAAEQCIQQRQTVVMLVPEDMSVGWFSKALESVDEVRIITDGRINFIEPSTGLEKKGNSKGSMLLIWRPFISPRRMFTTVSKAALMAIGQGVRRAA